MANETLLQTEARLAGKIREPTVESLLSDQTLVVAAVHRSVARAKVNADAQR